MEKPVSKEHEEIIRYIDKLYDVKRPVESSSRDHPKTVEVKTSKKNKRKRSILFDGLDLHKNPYRSESSLNLDDEYDNGFRLIETSLLLRLLRMSLTVNELKIFFYILHRTRGLSNPDNHYHFWHNHISIKKLIDDLQIPRTTVYRSLKTLTDKKMIYDIVNQYNENQPLTGINYRYDTWSS